MHQTDMPPEKNYQTRIIEKRRVCRYGYKLRMDPQQRQPYKIKGIKYWGTEMSIWVNQYDMCMKSAPNTQVDQNGRSWEATKIKHQRCRTMHSIKLKPHGRYQLLRNAGKKIKEDLIDSISLKECTEKVRGKIYRPDRRISHSGVYQCTINKFNGRKSDIALRLKKMIY